MAGSGEPTEEPTGKRLEEARRRGDVASSRDLVSAVALTAAIAALAARGPWMTAELVGLFRGSLAGGVGGGSRGPAVAAALGTFVRVLVAPLAAAFAAALGIGLLQTRGLLALPAVKPDLGRLSPAKGLKRAFGGSALLQLGKGLLKVILVAAIAWVTMRPVLMGMTPLTGAPAVRVLAALGVLTGRLAWRVALVAIGLGVFDFLMAWRRHRRGLRMTREEVRREAKESEGDPSHRAERQRLHRELLEQRMVAEVRKADFVVVNPDHIAVALRYDREGDGAPVVVAVGERLVAERIKQVARQAGVPIFRDVTLARSLRGVPEGEEIPAALYEAVAEVLRVVYGLESPPAPPEPSVGEPGPAPAAPQAGWKRA